MSLEQDVHKIAEIMGTSTVRGTLQFGSLNAGGEAIVEYDFARNGGAVGNIVLPVEIPINSVITGGMMRIITAPTSGGAATVALRLEGAGDILAATAIASLTTGNRVIVPTPATANTWVTTTAARSLTVVVATAALTAGRFFVKLDYTTYPA